MWSRRLLDALKKQLPNYHWNARINQSGGYLYAHRQKHTVKIYVKKTRSSDILVCFFTKRGRRWVSEDEFETHSVENAENGILEWFSLLN
jgi:hypothetical protein